MVDSLRAADIRLLQVRPFKPDGFSMVSTCSRIVYEVEVRVAVSESTRKRRKWNPKRGGGVNREKRVQYRHTHRDPGVTPPIGERIHTHKLNSRPTREKLYSLLFSRSIFPTSHFILFFFSLFLFFSVSLSGARARAFFPIFTRVPNAHSRKNARAFTKPRHLQTLMQYSAQSQRENVRGYSTMACTQCALAALP